MDIIYVTGNKFKIEMAQNILGPLGVNVIQKKIDCIEIQDDEIAEVSKYSASFAAKQLNCEVIKNDSGLVIDSLKGFPGPYTSYIEDTITEEGILALMNGVDDRKARFVEVITYCKPNKEPVSFVSNTYGTISTDKKGEMGWSFDKIFIPQGETRTLAEIPDSDRWKFWSNDAYLQLKDYLMKL